MTAFWDSVDGQLADLNRQAAQALDDLVPEPEGLPPTGSWIRAYVLDDDAQAAPASPWHHVTGWQGRWGVLSTRCRGRPGQVISAAVRSHVGVPATWWNRGRRGDRYILDVSLERPADGVCRQCEIGLARDAEAIVAAERAREQAALVELLPAVGAIATDAAIDDAERGRRLRGLWPAPEAPADA